MKKILIPSAYMKSDLDDLDKVSYFYSRFVSNAGALPIIAPSVLERVPEYVSMVDAVILIGGVNDLDPSFYGHENNGSKGCNLNQDKFEFAILDEAIKQNKPILGICRGMQLINVYFGGSLIQHLENSDLHLQYPKQEELVHEVFIKNSRFFTDKEISVNSVHHQACDFVPDTLRVTAKSNDGTVEMIEHVSLPIVGVQWHPECISYTDFSNELIRLLLKI